MCYYNKSEKIYFQLVTVTETILNCLKYFIFQKYSLWKIVIIFPYLGLSQSAFKENQIGSIYLQTDCLSNGIEQMTFPDPKQTVYLVFGWKFVLKSMWKNRFHFYRVLSGPKTRQLSLFLFDPRPGPAKAIRNWKLNEYNIITNIE